MLGMEWDMGAEVQIHKEAHKYVHINQTFLTSLGRPLPRGSGGRRLKATCAESQIMAMFKNSEEQQCCVAVNSAFLGNLGLRPVLMVGVAFPYVWHDVFLSYSWILLFLLLKWECLLKHFSDFHSNINILNARKKESIFISTVILSPQDNLYMSLLYFYMYR